MGTLERTATLRHTVGARGRVSVKGVTGLVRVRPVDGEEARLTVTYRVRASDREAAERALAEGEVQVERGDGYLAIETADRRISAGLSWLFGGTRLTADLDLEVPRAAQLRVETVSGSIDAGGLAGEQRYRTISGDVRLVDPAGPAEASTVSGSVGVDASGDLALHATTVSGAIRARAASFRACRISTTSGQVQLGGAFDPAGEHRVDSLSGGLEVAASSGLTVEVKSLAGSIRSEVAHRVEGGHGASRAIVGDGAARLRFNTTSGQLRLLRPAAEPSAGRPGAAEQGEAGPAPDGDIDLDVLRALERGEIGVEEAAARLERPRA